VDPLHSFIGESDAARDIRRFAERAGNVDATVLITGESGTGKGILARAIHARSRRARAPFVAVNCASVPETLFESEFFGHARGAFTGAHQARRGLFEQAHGGTLFLDEIAELGPTLQAKLLTTLEDGEVRRLGAERTARVDVRLVAATNADLHAAVRTRAFRADLFHRLVILAIHLPPLRERGNDVDLFLHSFLARFADLHHRSIRGFEPAAYARLRHHPWPGNVRQLAHAVEAAVLACDDGTHIANRHLPFLLLDSEPTAPADLTDHPPATGRRYSFYGSYADEQSRIEDALRRCHGNRTRAAAVLGMSRNTLRAKLRETPNNAAVPPGYGRPPTNDSDSVTNSRTVPLESAQNRENGPGSGADHDSQDSQ
jgi:DNA-binding NtrC family response regulator